MTGLAMKFNPGFLSDQELVDSFCVRVPEFEMLVQTIRESTDSSNPHQLVVGPRGTGKTTLLLRVVAEVRRDSELSAAWFPIIFPEESYEIGTCGEFWLSCLAHLANQAPQCGGGMDLARTLAEVRNERDDLRLASRCLGAVLDFAEQEDKRLLLVVENLNMLIADINDPDVGWQLRHTLQNENRIFLLASATSRFDEIERYGRAMYDLFSVQELKPLDTDACAVLWKTVSNRDPERNVVRSLEILTGGNPRLLTIVARFGSMLSFPELMDNLLRLVDDHTEYFKSHLDALGFQDRKVYLALARLWRPATAREVSEHARMPTNNCSAVLGRLVDRGAVLIAGGEPRRKQYYVAERMYNIYYLLRMGRGSDRLVEALVRFMRSFYSESELYGYLGLLLRESDSLDDGILRQLTLALESSERVDPYETAGPAEIRKLDELMAKANDLFESNEWAQVVRACEELESLIGPDASLPELEYRAHSRNLRAAALNELARPKQALALYSETWHAHDNSDSAPLLKEAAIAGANRISLLAMSGASDETILEACDGLLDLIDRNSFLQMVEQHAAALYHRANSLSALGRMGDALSTYDDLVTRFVGENSLGVERCVVSALHSKGRLFDESGRFDEAREIYDSAVRRYGDSSSSETIGLVARVMMSMGASFCASNQLDDALLCFDRAINGFEPGCLDETAEALAKARFNKAAVLEGLGQSERALQEYDKLIGTLDTRNVPCLIEVAVRGCTRKAVLLSTVGRVEESLAAFNTLVNRFGMNQAPEIVRQVSFAKLERGKLEIREGRYDEALDTINGVLVNTETIDDQDRLLAFLLRAEVHFMRDRVNECEPELSMALELLATMPEVPSVAMEALFAFTIRLGPKSVLDLIDSSSSASLLHPFAVALRQDLGIATPVATEVAKVAEDIRAKLDEKRQLGAP